MGYDMHRSRSGRVWKALVLLPSNCILDDEVIRVLKSIKGYIVPTNVHKMYKIGLLVIK